MSKRYYQFLVLEAHTGDVLANPVVEISKNGNVTDEDLDTLTEILCEDLPCERISCATHVRYGYESMEDLLGCSQISTAEVAKCKPDYDAQVDPDGEWDLRPLERAVDAC